MVERRLQKPMNEAMLEKMTPLANKSIDIWEVSAVSRIGMQELIDAGIARRWRRGLEPKKAPR